MLEQKTKKIWLIVTIVLGVCLIVIPGGLIGGGLLIYKLQNTIASSSGDLPGEHSEAMDSNSLLRKINSPSPLFQDAQYLSVDTEGAVTASASADDFELVDNSSSEQKIIKTGSLNLTVDSTEGAMAEIKEIVQAKQGYISNSQIYTTKEDKLAGTIILRMPAQEFEQSITEIKKLAKVVTQEQISGQDITEEYVDLLSRLKNMQAEEAQYLEILKKAGSIADTLAVTKQLNIVREEIEVVQGRLNYMDDQTELSTVTVYLTEKTELGALADKWQPSENVRQAFRAWVRFLQSLVDRSVWLLLFLIPPALIIYLIVRLIIWRIRKHRVNVEN